MSRKPPLVEIVEKVLAEFLFLSFAFELLLPFALPDDLTLTVLLIDACLLRHPIRDDEQMRDEFVEVVLEATAVVVSPARTLSVQYRQT